MEVLRNHLSLLQNQATGDLDQYSITSSLNSEDREWGGMERLDSLSQIKSKRKPRLMMKLPSNNNK
jgi:hypothetical protein